MIKVYDVKSRRKFPTPLGDEIYQMGAPTPENNERFLKYLKECSTGVRKKLEERKIVGLLKRTYEEKTGRVVDAGRENVPPRISRKGLAKIIPIWGTD